MFKMPTVFQIKNQTLPAHEDACCICEFNGKFIGKKDILRTQEKFAETNARMIAVVMEH